MANNSFVHIGFKGFRYFPCHAFSLMSTFGGEGAYHFLKQK